MQIDPAAQLFKAVSQLECCNSTMCNYCIQACMLRRAFFCYIEQLRIIEENTVYTV